MLNTKKNLTIVNITPAVITELPFKSRIISGDVVEVLKNLDPTYKFEVIVADSPYNLGKNFGNNHDNMQLADYVNWTSTSG